MIDTHIQKSMDGYDHFTTTKLLIHAQTEIQQLERRQTGLTDLAPLPHVLLATNKGDKAASMCEAANAKEADELAKHLAMDFDTVVVTARYRTVTKA